MYCNLFIYRIYIYIYIYIGQALQYIIYIYRPGIGIPLFSQRAQVMMTPAEQKQSYESFWNKGQRFYVWQPWQMYNRFLVVNTLRLWKWCWWLRKWMIWLEFKSVAKVCRDFLGFESGMSCCCCWRLCGIGINVVIRLHTFKWEFAMQCVFLLNILDVPYRTIRTCLSCCLSSSWEFLRRLSWTLVLSFLSCLSFLV